ncbi:TPA: hypothetical protein ACH3X3_014432 [Trebouxia sp. C0006]
MMRQVSRGSWKAFGSKSVCTKRSTQGGSPVISRAHTQAANRHSGLGASAIPCLITHDQYDPDRSHCRWEVQVTQNWDAVRRLGEVSSLATDVFYENEGFEPLVNFSKIICKSELLIRLGWRLAKPNKTSCFVIAHPAVESNVCKGLAGMLEVSIQAYMPPLFLGNSQQVAVVTTMAVLPEMQRQGIGTALLEATQCWAASRDVKVVALFVYRDNYTAIRLYERVGFERVVNWVDPLWLACAEKGMIGPTRRVLYIKQLPSVMN